ncbi:MAG: prepilin-type N-terminal cleavage/methylation domain-containing protein [Betaproteobacteria bacterium]|nr:prepilin-type N-terminal cleavage/methylation domain-containing protein [Betaproteobacteria bacterium]
MKARSFAHARRETASGFTLVELMIAVVIVALLASIALPSFMDSIRKSRRSEAFAALSAVQQAQERWRGNHGSYAARPLASARPGAPPGRAAWRDDSRVIKVRRSLPAQRVTATASARRQFPGGGNCVRHRRPHGRRQPFTAPPAAAGDLPTRHNRCWAR